MAVVLLKTEKRGATLTKEPSVSFYLSLTGNRLASWRMKRTVMADQKRRNKTENNNKKKKEKVSLKAF